MSLLSKLLGGAGAAAGAAKPETYKGFTIRATPVKESGRWRVAARIEKEVGGEPRVHELIRADVLESHDAACDTSLAKARQMIDEQGDGVFRKRG